MNNLISSQPSSHAVVIGEGTIQVESQLGQGSIFTIVLPIY